MNAKQQQLYDRLFERRYMDEHDRIAFSRMNNEFINAYDELALYSQKQALILQQLEAHQLTEDLLWGLLETRKQEIINTLNGGILKRKENGDPVSDEDYGKAVSKMNLLLLQYLRNMHQYRMNIVRGQKLPTDSVFGF